ncbi:MAG: hypothetical protein JW833_12115 [Prolixibacteraceae bacterium]|nr:hypothetical protein [Prolixibacteraceae bacterium]
MNKVLKQQYPFIIPIIIAIYLIILNVIDSPASLTRIDPEYLCLLNGLNVSILQFDNIGYTDLPGTPFLVLTGIFIRIIHLFSGKGAIVDDVILRPDFYIQDSSYLLILLTLLILIWGGIRIYKSTNNIFAVFVLQASLLFSPVTLSLQIRYNADRFLPVLVFIFAVFTIMFLYQSISSRKYALFSGIIIGIGFITKFNFVALTILPVFLFVSYKDWLIYGGSFIVSSFISFLPIIDKFQNVKRFITGLAENQGTYGQGGKQMFDLDVMFNNLKELPGLNQVFTFIIILSIVTILILIIRKKHNSETKKILFLIGFLMASAIEIVMVSKHFKNYYLAPVLGLSGLIFYLIWEAFFSRKKTVGFITGGVVLLIFVTISLSEVRKHVEITRSKLSARELTVKQFDEEISSSDYLLFEPAWISGPSQINGLLWGLNYVADRNDFTDTYVRQYPNVITYEGDSHPFKVFKTKDADIEKIFREGNTIYLFSTPGRNTQRVIREMERQAKQVNTEVKKDTVFVNETNNDILIKASFTTDTIISVTKLISFFNDMEGIPKYWKQNSVVSELSFSGNKSTRIMRGSKYSSSFEINPQDTLKGNILSLEISCKYFQEKIIPSIRMVIDITSEKGGRLWYPVYISDYSKTVSQWDDFKYKIYVPEKYGDANSLKVYFYSTIKMPFYIDDFEVEIKSQSL